MKRIKSYYVKLLLFQNIKIVQILKLEKNIFKKINVSFTLENKTCYITNAIQFDKLF